MPVFSQNGYTFLIRNPFIRNYYSDGQKIKKLHIWNNCDQIKKIPKKRTEKRKKILEH